jgi:hypothetical protein
MSPCLATDTDAAALPSHAERLVGGMIGPS